MNWNRFMAWLYPNDAQAGRAHLAEVLVESGRARELARKSATNVAVLATEDREKIEATRREIRCRRDRRIERERQRPVQDPGLMAAMNALRLLERKQ